MKTMKDFAAQQLTKKQMNDVRGGYWIVICTIYPMTEDRPAPGTIGEVVTGTGETWQEAMADATMQMKDGYLSAGCRYAQSAE